MHVSYEPSFFPFLFMSQRHSMQAITQRGKKGGSITYRADREDKVIEILFLLYLYSVSDGVQERFLFMRNDFKFLIYTSIWSKTNQFEIVS